MPICQVCQKDNPEGVEYCEDCGASLANAGSAVPVGAAAPGAGTPAASGSMSAPETTPPTPSAPSTAESSAAAPATSGAPPTGPGGLPAAPSAEPAPGPDIAQPGGAPPTATAQRPRLVPRRYGASTDEEIPLLGDRMVVGRFDPETGPVDIDLGSLPGAEHISRQHGELYRDASGLWMVRDLGSTNGIFVKGPNDASFGPRIAEPRPLASGDELAFGNARFTFLTD